MQVDKLVQLLESPIFVLLRLQLLDRSAPLHAHLLKSLYGPSTVHHPTHTPTARDGGGVARHGSLLSVCVRAGMLMILPQSSAYRTLSDRLLTVSTHHQIIAAAAATPPAHPTTVGRS